MKFKLIKSGCFDDGEACAPFEITLGEFETIDRAREEMKSDVLATEEYNDYKKNPEDSEESFPLGENGHRYEFNDCTGNYIEWSIEEVDD